MHKFDYIIWFIQLLQPKRHLCEDFSSTSGIDYITIYLTKIFLFMTSTYMRNNKVAITK